MSPRPLFRAAAIGLLALAACSSPESAHDTTTEPVALAADPATPRPAAPAPVEAKAGPVHAGATPPTPGPVPASGGPAAAAPRPYRDDIPFAPAGKARRRSLVDGKEDPTRLDDPERDSVERGRRLVPPNHDVELTDGFDSAEALAEAVLDRAMWNDFEALLGLRIRRSEFDSLFWPEFPQSRPATGIAAGDAWAFHDAACRDGVTAILSSYGGADLHFVGVRFEVGFTPYANFTLYRGAVIEAVSDRGESVEIRAATDFAERNGRWRVFLFDS